MGFNQEDFKYYTMYDFAVPQKTSLDLFGYFLKITNSKAICISSWVTLSEHDKRLDEIEKIFALISDQFPENWLVGNTGGSGGDRWTDSIEPIVKDIHPNCKYVVFDDGAKEYKYKETSVQVDSMLGLNIYDFLKGFDILNDKTKIENDYLNLLKRTQKN